jgi:nicotinamidase-related amidase
MHMQKVHLLVIDPQFDFCDPSGALFVAGADQDIVRLASFVDRVRDKLEAIHVTLDCHHLVDIAHPIFWVDKDGKHPDPFTIISASDVADGVWRTTKPSWQKRALEYVRGLEKNGRYPLCVWPPHCLIGTPGNNVHEPLLTALQAWETDKMRTVDYVTKGSNPWTEHYSAVQADVPDAEDPSTQINTGLITTLERADIILVAGEAGSHCLANTVRDVANNFGDDSYVQKLVLLEDGTSPVPTFESFQDDFVAEMKKRGMKVSTTTDWMA